MRFLSFFSGFGGMDLGLERAGMTCIGQVEIDPYARAVLEKHWPGVKRMEDVRDVQGTEFGEFEYLVGGFPCQDVSNAGHRAGISGERSGLYGELVRCLRVVRPLGAVLENVAALLARGMGTVVGDLAEIGYDAEWDCVPACAVGAPHCRDRVFIVAHPKWDEQSRKEPCRWPVGRMGREQQSIPWDRPWQVALAEFRGVDHGIPRSVERTDGLRNAVVPQVAEVIGRAIMVTQPAKVAEKEMC